MKENNSEGSISVCPFCYQAVIQLRRGMSDWVHRAKCVKCGRVFVLDLQKKGEDNNDANLPNNTD
jgi:Zn ribbon nucleic-acid-binding protein